jgi:hypothetical protein
MGEKIYAIKVHIFALLAMRGIRFYFYCASELSAVISIMFFNKVLSENLTN